MKLTFLGATGTVTGSKTLVEHEGHRLLVDCGMYQGFKNLRQRNWSSLPVPARELDAVVLTHAHIDHSGWLPLLYKQGFRKRVWCTESTAELCRILLPDAGHLQEEEAAYANRKGFSRHHPALPLYTEADAVASLKLLAPVEWDRRFQAVPGVEACLLRAGHILGASMVRLAAGGRSVLFSGDLGRPNDPIMRAPVPPPQADALVIESTYGNRTHEAGDPGERIAEVINRTIERQGVVLIPAFAVGRAQSILWHVVTLKERGLLPASLPVYLNSPMAVDATAIYRRHPGEHRLDREACARMGAGASVVNTPQDSINLNAMPGPMVVIAASGMATGGRVVHHLKAFAPDARNTILLVGFQAGGTRGAALLEGAPTIKIHGEHVPVRAEVASINNLSAHADANELIAWARAMPAAPQQVFVNHGEPGAADTFRLRLTEELGWNASVPDYRDTAEV